MQIHEFLWPADRVDHIARHGVQPEEVEEVCFGQALVQHAKAHGNNPVYYVLGETSSGRHLLCVVIQFPNGRGRHGASHDSQREGAVQTMEEAMTAKRLPSTDSIEDLAKFWDAHDLTDFEAELEEPSQPVFVRARGTPLSVALRPVEMQHLKRIAAIKRRQGDDRFAALDS